MLANGLRGLRRAGVAGLADTVAGLRHWSARRWLLAVGAAAFFAVAAGVPTDVIPTPPAHREVPTAWWNYPALAATALLGGMLAATYVRTRAERDVTGRSAGGGVLSLLAISCPACNKLVVLLGWALRARLAAEQSCPVPRRRAAVPATRVGRDG